MASTKKKKTAGKKGATPKQVKGGASRSKTAGKSGAKKASKKAKPAPKKAAKASSGKAGKAAKGGARTTGAAKASKPAKATKPPKATKATKATKAPKATKSPAKKAGGTTGGAGPKKAKTTPPTAAPKTAKVKFAAPRAPKSTIRTPEGAEELKQKLGALASSVNQIRSLKRTMNKSFYDIGQILREIRDERLYEVKGYGSFEAFVEREIDLGKQLSLKIVRIVQTFLKEAALKAGLERVTAALEALEGDEEQQPPPSGGPSSTATGTRSPIPIHKQ